MYRSFTLLITTLAVLTLHIGCQQDGDLQKSPSSRPNTETKTGPTTEVTVGGKTWEIAPKRSYQAIGVWINPNPRPPNRGGTGTVSSGASRTRKVVLANRQT